MLVGRLVIVSVMSPRPRTQTQGYKGTASRTQLETCRERWRERRERTGEWERIGEVY